MGISVRLITTASICLLLGACTGTKEQTTISKSFLYQGEAGYLITAYPGFTYSELAPSGEYYYFGYPLTNDTGLRTIEIYDSILSVRIFKDHDKPTCTPSLIGVHEAISQTGNNSTWGRVDIWDDMHMEGWDPADAANVICKKEGINPPKEIYALCSENNGKTVVICINQMTDNPALAKQIFETFRWLPSPTGGEVE